MAESGRWPDPACEPPDTRSESAVENGHPAGGTAGIHLVRWRLMSTYDDLVAAVEPPPRVRKGLLALEKELAAHRVVGSSPDGAVTVTVTGGGELVAVV